MRPPAGWWPKPSPRTVDRKVSMETIEIAGTGLTPSRIGLGTWAIGGWMWDRRQQLLAGADGGIPRGGSATHRATALQPVRARHRARRTAVLPPACYLDLDIRRLVPRPAVRTDVGGNAVPRG